MCSTPRAPGHRYRGAPADESRTGHAYRRKERCRRGSRDRRPRARGAASPIAYGELSYAAAGGGQRVSRSRPRHPVKAQKQGSPDSCRARSEPDAVSDHECRLLLAAGGAVRGGTREAVCQAVSHTRVVHAGVRVISLAERVVCRYRSFSEGSRAQQACSRAAYAVGSGRSKTDGPAVLVGMIEGAGEAPPAGHGELCPQPLEAVDGGVVDVDADGERVVSLRGAAGFAGMPFLDVSVPGVQSEFISGRHLRVIASPEVERVLGHDVPRHVIRYVCG